MLIRPALRLKGSVILFACMLAVVSAILGVSAALAASAPTSSQSFPSLSPNRTDLGEKPEIYWYDGKWPHERSELAPNPKIRFGRLDNGFRYAIIPNKNESGRVAMFLDIQVGSLMEEAHELGYAHFIEHMAFNGSRNFPENSLVPFLQWHGLGFGNDTNAHTGWTETVYKLNLADTKQETLDTAFMVMRDFADGMLMDQAQVEEEKRVILAEKAARDSESALAWRRMFGRINQGTRFVEEIIGREDSILSATPESLLHFYRKWYRPERMILVLVGPVDESMVGALAEKHFSSLEPSESLPHPPAWGNVPEHGLRAIFDKRPISGVELYMVVPHPRRHSNDSHQTQANLSLDSVAEYCLYQRLLTREQKEPGLWKNARFRNNWRKGLLPASYLRASATQENWRKAVTAMAEEVNSALTFGFSQAEIDQAVQFFNQVFAVRMFQHANRENTELAQEFISLTNSDRVYTSLEDDMSAFTAIQPQLTPEAVSAALRESLDLSKMQVTVSGNINVQDAELLALWNDAMSKEAQRFSIGVMRDFPYLELPDSPQNLPEMTVTALGPEASGEHTPKMHATILPNGLELYILPVSFETDKIKAELLFGPGFENLDDKGLAVARLAGPVLKEGGLGDLNLLETRKVFDAMGGSVKENYSVLSGEISGVAAVNKMDALLTAIWTQFLDPHPSQAALDKVIMTLDMQRQRRFETVNGVDKAEGYAFFNGDGRRFRPLEADEARQVSLAEIEDLIRQSRRVGPIRLLISGNIEPDEVLKNAARLFGALDLQLASHDSLPTFTEFNPIFPAGKEIVRHVPDEVDKAVVRVAWQCNLDDISKRRTLTARQMAAQVLRDRVRLALREETGASYSPSVTYTMSAVDKGYGFLTVEVETDSSKVDSVRRMIRDLTYIEVNEIELERLRGPMRTGWLGARKRNDIWHRMMNNEVLLGQPYGLWHSRYAQDLDALSAEEVSREMRIMFDGERAEWIIMSKHAADMAAYGPLPDKSEEAPGTHSAIEEQDEED